MIGIAKHARSGAVRRDVPGVELGYRPHFASGPVQPTKRLRPYREHQVTRGPQKGLVHDELVVSMFVETLEPGAVAPHAVHARRRIAGEFDPLRIERMKLRMNHRARERNQAPTTAITTADDNAAAVPLFHRGGQPLPSRALGALDELRAGKLDNHPLREALAIYLPNAPTAHEEDAVAVRMNRRRVRMDGRAIAELADFAIGKRRLEQLSASRAVRREDQRRAVRREGALQKVRRMIDRRMICELADARAGYAIDECAPFGRMPRSLSEH